MTNKSCQECGSEISLVKCNKKTLCRNCHAEAHGQRLRFATPTIEIVEELRMQGKTYEFIADHFGVTGQAVWKLRKKTI